MGCNGHEASVSSIASPFLAAHHKRAEINVVMYDQKIFQRDFIKLESLLHRLTGKIHESLRFEEMNFPYFWPSEYGHESLALGLPVRPIVGVHQGVENPEPDVVACVFIGDPWVAKTNKEIGVR